MKIYGHDGNDCDGDNYHRRELHHESVVQVVLRPFRCQKKRTCIHATLLEVTQLAGGMLAAWVVAYVNVRGLEAPSAVPHPLGRLNRVEELLALKVEVGEQVRIL